MILKEIGRKIAQAFRLAKAADEKVASSIAAALDAKAEQIKEYEKRFEPDRNRILYWKHTHHWRRLDSVQQPPHMRSGDSQKA